MNKKLLTPLIAMCSFSAVSQAQVYITPMLGYSFGGEVENSKGTHFDIEEEINYNIAIEADIQKGRLGLLYSQQNSNIENLNIDTTLRYLHFQSAIYYPLNDKINTYLGLSLGGTHIDVQGADNEFKFSGGLFGGMEYTFAHNVALQAQLRYIGTLVDSDSITFCESNSSSPNCQFLFKGEWMSQFQANIGLTFSF